jgi:D-beta-D-heptose 7-phosphate kinase/D-beta-D-heptose 1-phosphate adenosyltransferase
MFDSKKACRRRGLAVLCIGDLMLDDFVYGEVSRDLAGSAGAGHRGAARGDRDRRRRQCRAQHRSARRELRFVGIVGNDEAGAPAALRRIKHAHRAISCRSSRPTTRKLRFVSEHFSTHLLRADWEERAGDRKVETALIDQALNAAAARRRGGAVRLRQGRADPRSDSRRHRRALKLDKPVIVDPKGLDYSIYRGATLITPNRKELGDAAHHPVKTHGRGGGRRQQTGEAGPAARPCSSR